MRTTSVRRNLFRNHLSKRAASSGPSNGASSLPSQKLQPGAPESNSSLFASSADDEEIVVKDKNGGYKLDIPVLPIIGDDGEEGEAVEGGGAPGNPASAARTNAAEQGGLSGREKEKMAADLIEMMYRNRNRQMSSEPQEILNLIYQSLENKVAALDEDNWMYEPELNTRV